MRDYKKLINVLRTMSEKTRGLSMLTGISGDGLPVLFDDSADAIEELLAAVPQWISVDERLPEIGRFVLVSDGDDIDAACRYKAFTIPEETEPFFWDSVLEVTHWMPLPEPPTEVE